MASRQTIGAEAIFNARVAAAVAPSLGHTGAFAATTAFTGACVVAVVIPFELSRPVLQLPWQSISNLELILALAIGAWLVSVAVSPTGATLSTPLTQPWLLVLATMVLAAAAAPADRVNALHMAGRLTIGFGVFLLVVNGVSSVTRLRLAMTAVVASGVVVGLLAILEYFRVAVVLEGLRAFRPSLFAVGSLVRAGGTLQYPTIASMYLEVVFAFGLGLLLTALDRHRRATAAVLFAGVAIVGDAIMWTFTRTGLATMAIGLAFVGAMRYSKRGGDRGVRSLAALAALLLVLFATSRPAQAVWLRMTSEGQDEWYRASMEAPATLALATGSSSTVRVRVRNLGRLTWDSTDDPPIYLSYHWLQADGERVVNFNGARTSFSAPVPSGETVSVDALVRAPQRPGEYRLEWDVVQEHRLWFNTEPGAANASYSQATVTGIATGGPIVTTPRPRRAVRPGRLLLWRAAARMFAAHPLLGVGADNFRLQYGPYAGLPNADPRIHSNNMYIEMFVGGGLVGGLAFLWLVGRAAGCSAAAAAHAADPRSACALGIAAAGLAVVVHGAVDSFLSFTPTYVLIAFTLGLAVAATRDAEAVTDAHRI